jgi:hypothetical protein
MNRNNPVCVASPRVANRSTETIAAVTDFGVPFLILVWMGLAFFLNLIVYRRLGES